MTIHPVNQVEELFGMPVKHYLGWGFAPNCGGAFSSLFCTSNDWHTVTCRNCIQMELKRVEKELSKEGDENKAHLYVHRAHLLDKLQ